MAVQCINAIVIQKIVNSVNPDQTVGIPLFMMQLCPNI